MNNEATVARNNFVRERTAAGSQTRSEPQKDGPAVTVSLSRGKPPPRPAANVRVAVTYS